MTWRALAFSLIGAVVVAIITGLYLQRRGKKQIMTESITRERREYREKMRELTVAFVSETDKTLKEDIRNEILLRLNPYDDADKKRIELMNELIADPDCEERKNQFLYSMQCLLKYDWERSKEEAGLTRKHGEWKKRLRKAADLFATEKESDKLKPALDINHELPTAPREFAVAGKKDES